MRATALRQTGFFGLTFIKCDENPTICTQMTFAFSALNGEFDANLTTLGRGRG
jgi:hypothetical protein